MMTTDVRHLTVQSADASRMATTRDDWDRAHTNAALTRYEIELGEARHWYTAALHARGLAPFTTSSQTRADRAWHAQLVHEAARRLEKSLARTGGRR